MPRVVHFEIYADDLDRAEKFYTETFGWTVDRLEGEGFVYHMVNTGEEPAQGINGGLIQRPDPGAVINIILDVPSVDEYTARITQAGGILLAPKFAVPGVGYAAYFRDTEGNPFGIFQDDTTAA